MTYPKSIHLLIYSNLESYGGGRERWLNYFLKNIYNKVVHINVYFLEKEYNKNTSLLSSQFTNISNISWYSIKSKNYLEWIVRTTRFLVPKINDGDLILSIGSGPEGIVGMIVKKKFKTLSTLFG